jgi:hypothetical protein
MNWLPNDLSAEGASSLGGPGVCPWIILKIRTLNYELQFDLKNGKTLEKCHISEFDFFAPLLTKANRGA